jgi:hypothetical protein
MNTHIEFKIGTFVEAKDYKKMEWDEFDKYLRKERPIHLHEVLQGRVLPYFDFDPKYGEEGEARMMEAPILTMAHNAVQKQYPGGNVILGSSFGWSSKKNAWVCSARLIVRNAGYYNSPADIKPVAEKLAVQLPDFDLGVYHERKTMRGFFQVKECDPDRPMRRMLSHKGKLTEAPQDKDGNIHLLGENWLDYFITNTKGEMKCLSTEEKKDKKKKAKKDDSDDEPRKKKQKNKKDESESDSESDSDSDDEDTFDHKGWTYERAKDVIDRLDDDRADTHRKRIIGLTSIAHLANSS